jgi:hypothetical protein
MNQVLLARLDKDYVTQVENGSNFRLTGNAPYQQAVENLQEDVEAWSAQLGVNLQLNSELEVVEETVAGSAKLTRRYTCLYATVDDNDYAWMAMNLGNIQPSTGLTFTDHRGWCFRWTQSGTHAVRGH